MMKIRPETTSGVRLCLRAPTLVSGTARRQDNRRPRRDAFSLAETLISVILVGGLMVTALNTAGASLATRKNMSDHAVAQLLAQDLMAEIVEQAYLEPTDSPVFGRETGEPAVTRSPYDDVDDYDKWSASPPEDKDGTAIAGMAGWRRRVEVVWVRANNLRLRSTSGEETNVKRITVDVFDNDEALLASLCSVRTNSAATAAPPVNTAVDPTPLPPPVLVN